MFSRRRSLALAVLLAALTTAPSAAAAPTVTLSSAAKVRAPDIAVDATGTGHVAWNESVDSGPDTLHYCRLPRGATVCAQETVIPGFPAEVFGRPRVVLGPAGVVITSYRCCGDGSDLGTVWATISADSGATFGAPIKIGRGENSGDAVFGPGDFSVSYASSVSSGGVRFFTAPLDGSGGTTDPVNFDQTQSAANKAYYGSIGFVSPTQPIVAYGDLTNTFYRVWTGQGSINDISTWSPEAQIPNLDEPRLASGPRGVFLMGNPENDVVYDYDWRRLQPDGTFSAPQPLTLPDDSAIFGDTFQDTGGNVHAVWNANNKGRFIRRVSTDGKTFRGREDLGPTEGAAFNPQIGAGPDGGGWIVHDNNGSPPIRATVLPPVKAGTGAEGEPGSASCPTEVNLGGGKVVVKAITGCLKKQADGTFRTTDPVRVNGVDVGAQGAATAAVARAARSRGIRGVATVKGRAAATATITVDTKTGEVKATGQAETKLGSVVLDKGGFTWSVAKGGLGVAATFTDLGKFKAPPVLGFPLVGKAELKFTDKGVEVKVNMKLPSPLDSVTADATLRGTLGEGLKLQGLKIAVKDVFIGALRVKSLVADYLADPSTFKGDAAFLLPPTYTARDEAKISFTFREGKLVEAVASRIPFTPAYPIAPPFASLPAIGFGIRTEPALTLLGGAEIAAGPVILGKAAAKINALPPNGFKLSFGDPVTFRFDGTLELVSFNLASAFLEYRVPGYIGFGGGVDYTAPANVLRAVIKVLPESFIDVSSGKFNAVATAQVCVPASCPPFPFGISAGATGAFSSTGAAICTNGSPSFGFGFTWGGDASLFLDGGCSVGSYTATAAASRAAFRQAGAGTVQVRGGVDQANIAVRGVDGAPFVRVTAPDGTVFEVTPAAPALQNPRAIAIANQEARATVFYLANPVAGAYKVEALPGGAAIADARVAQGLPDVDVKASVAGKARARTLRYRVKTIPGQVVTFSEVRAGVAAKVIGTAKGPAGTLRFRPAEGKAGKRSIVALVEQNGKPRSQVTVASYTAPGPLRPGRPRFARVSRSSGGLKVTWGTSANATGYAVRATLNDGRRQLFVVGGKTRSLRIPAVSGQFSGKITVAGLRGGPKGGPTRTATVRAVKRKKARKRR